ncbi:MAG: cytochrome C oxidase Cbb3 [Candidatus Accumulibacter meliphilus]|jgi:mono/diheme cytochrome c family protein/DNA-binding beta-propeller fold protein YncE|uniref:Cytochrome C oxidase Cbb3 n=1 Tax=Candidatus Accumulibacter meliphilus TaxID=2211374 RepID=A0A369XN60_9PROT|nr:MAG: cytochrome C oxidase Cbb3 [Candidatus Accumulibacter meliphilus]
MNWRLAMSAACLAASLAGGSSFASAAGAPEAAGVQALYKEHCAACHGETRFGGVGPALLPENLARLRKPEALKVIGEGRVATQMPAFGDKLSADQVQELADLIYSPVTPAPKWDAAEIRASQVVNADAGKLPDQPGPGLKGADPLNLFIVVETGDHHVSVLDGDKLERLHRFPSRYALHGGPKFSPDGRFVYFASRDGWITKFDIYNLVVVAEIRAGLNTRNAAVSGDGKWVMVANYLPHSLVLLDAKDLSLVKIIPTLNAAGDKTSRVSAVYDAAPRKSFVAALKDVPEVWEISYDPDAEPVAEGLVHDYQYREGHFTPAMFYPRRTLLKDYLDDFFFTQSYHEILGASRSASKGQVIFLDGRNKIADLDLPGMPHLGSGITWQWTDPTGRERSVMASPNLNEGVVTVIDLETYNIIKEIKTLGPGFFLRSHENSRYAFTDSMMSKENRNVLQVIDKQSLEVVGQIKAKPGQTLAHVEFTRDGRYALASLWEDDGALLVIDAQTLEEVKRIPARKPVGKYNVWNKISRSEGTSH